MKMLFSMLLFVCFSTKANSTAIDYATVNGQWMEFELYTSEYFAMNPTSQRSNNFYRDMILAYDEAVRIKGMILDAYECDKKADAPLTEADTRIPQHYHKRLKELKRKRYLDNGDKKDLKLMCPYSSLYKVCETASAEDILTVLKDEGFFEERDVRTIAHEACVNKAVSRPRDYTYHTHLGAYRFYFLWDYLNDWYETFERDTKFWDPNKKKGEK